MNQSRTQPNAFWIYALIHAVNLAKTLTSFIHNSMKVFLPVNTHNQSAGVFTMYHKNQSKKNGLGT